MRVSVRQTTRNKRNHSKPFAMYHMIPTRFENTAKNDDALVVSNHVHLQGKSLKFTKQHSANEVTCWPSATDRYIVQMYKFIAVAYVQYFFYYYWKEKLMFNTF